MKAAARILVTATALAALSTLGLAATATAGVPPADERSQHPTTTVGPATVPTPATAPRSTATTPPQRPPANLPPTRTTPSRGRSRPWPSLCSAWSSPWPG
jgi:hypothetical protein